jgi:hypothetical protein
MIRNYITSWEKCNLPMKKFMNGKSWAKKDRSSGGMALLPLATGTAGGVQSFPLLFPV